MRSKHLRIFELALGSVGLSRNGQHCATPKPFVIFADPAEISALIEKRC